MAVSVIGAVATTTPVNGSFYNIAANTLSVLTGLAAGAYRFRAWSQSNNATPTGTVQSIDGSGNVLTTTSFVDWDSASSTNYSEVVISFASTVVNVAVTLNVASFVSIESLGVLGTAKNTLLTYQSSQTVVIPSTARCVLIGGGGGGGTGVGGAGGGSGYMQSFNTAAGSYALVVGAGGIGNTAAGGASTFNGNTANGGSGGNGYTGGAGGSGGGGNGGNSIADGGRGGYNGGSGYTYNDSAPGGTGGAGSGVALPYWCVPGANGPRNGGGGGTYAGGGANNQSVSGNTGNGYGVGGGAGGGGATGAAGGLIVMLGL